MENRDPSLTIIMPVYNAAEDIVSSIKSIQNQTYQNWELIVVDDKSMDDTCKIVEAFIEEDSRILLLKQNENKGPGQAKNRAIKLARGKYVTFCDADDWIEPEYYVTMMNSACENFDVVVSGYYRDIYQNEELLSSNLVSMNTKETRNEKETINMIPMLDQNRLFSFAWNKIYKKSILFEKDIIFSNKKFGEDFDFNISFFSEVKTMKILDKGFYHYLKKNQNSLTEREVADFYEINKDRFSKLISLMKIKKCYIGTNRQLILTGYIKHIIAAIVRMYSSKSFQSLSEKRDRIKIMLSDQLSKEAIRYAKGESIVEKICNAVFKTRNITLNLCFGFALHIFQTKGKNISEKLKH